MEEEEEEERRVTNAHIIYTFTLVSNSDDSPNWQRLKQGESACRFCLSATTSFFPAGNGFVTL